MSLSIEYLWRVFYVQGFVPGYEGGKEVLILFMRQKLRNMPKYLVISAARQ
jgi:hypothetical protein